MLNRFYRFFGCMEDDALDCGSVTTMQTTAKMKYSAVEGRSIRDTQVTIVDDNGLECGSVKDRLTTARVKSSAAIARRSLRDNLATTKKVEGNTNIFEFVVLLNKTGSPMTKPVASEPIACPTRSILKYGIHLAAGTPIPTIYEDDAHSSLEDTDTLKEAVLKTPQQTITWGNQFFFEDEESAAKEDEVLAADNAGSTHTLVRCR